MRQVIVISGFDVDSVDESFRLGKQMSRDCDSKGCEHERTEYEHLDLRLDMESLLETGGGSLWRVICCSVNGCQKVIQSTLHQIFQLHYIHEVLYLLSGCVGLFLGLGPISSFLTSVENPWIDCSRGWLHGCNSQPSCADNSEMKPD